jgi:hypothetical protein
MAGRMAPMGPFLLVFRFLSQGSTEGFSVRGMEEILTRSLIPLIPTEHHRILKEVELSCDRRRMESGLWIYPP